MTIWVESTCPLPLGSPPQDPTGSATPYGFEPENTEELTPEQVRLHALEERLADVRRRLFDATRIHCPHRAEVRALAALAEQLHGQVLRQVLQGGSR